MIIITCLALRVMLFVESSIEQVFSEGVATFVCAASRRDSNAMNSTSRGGMPPPQPKGILRYDAVQAPVQKEDQQKEFQRIESDELFFIFYLSLLHRCSGLSTYVPII
jgi:hypothetical protein